jgi:hypothetical protein
MKTVSSFIIKSSAKNCKKSRQGFKTNVQKVKEKRADEENVGQWDISSMHFNPSE